MDNLFDLDLTHDVYRVIKTVYDLQELERIQESIREGVYKGFKVSAKDDYIGNDYIGYTYRYFCVFPTFIVSYMKKGASTHSFEIDTHTLGPIGIGSLKLGKLSYYDNISNVISRFQEFEAKVNPTQYHLHEIELIKFKCRQIDFDNERRATFEKEKAEAAFEKEKADQEIVRQAVELEEWRQALDRERQAFEEEKVAHELKVVRQAFELEEGRQALERDREAFERERRDLERELAKYKGIVGDCLKEISTYLE